MSRAYLEKIAKSAVLVFLGTLFGRLFGYLYVALVARLGSVEYGLLSLGFAIVSFLIALSLFGLEGGIVRFVSFYRGKNDKQRIKGTITSSLKIVFPVSIALSLLVFILANWISVSLFHNPELAKILRIFSIIIPLMAVRNIFLSTFKAFQKSSYDIGLREFGEKGIRFLLTFVVLFLGFGVIGIAFVWIISVFITALLSFYLLQKVFPLIKSNIKAISHKKELLSYSLPLLFGGFLSTTLAWADIMLLGFFKDASTVGVYNVALPTAALIFVAPTAITYLFMPIITELFAKERIDEVKKMYKRVSKWVFFVNFPIFLLVFLFSKQILRVMFGQEYITAGVALSILSVGYLIYSLAYPSTYVIEMAKKTKLILLSTLFFTLFNVVFNVLLIPRYGILGAGIATSVSFVFGFILRVIFAYRILRVQPFLLNYLKAIVAGIGAVACVLFIVSYLRPLSFFFLVASFVLFLGIYWLLLILIGGLDIEDKSLIRGIILHPFKK
ncbi:MAG: flippase [Candidatus Woesearchaeota archaeon]